MYQDQSDILPFYLHKIPAIVRMASLSKVSCLSGFILANQLTPGYDPTDFIVLQVPSPSPDQIQVT